MGLWQGTLEGLEEVKTLIFGATGFVGSNVLRLFLRKGDEMHVCLRKNSDTWRIKDLLGDLNVRVGDLSLPQSIEKVISTVKPDYVINCSGIVKGFVMDDQRNVVQSNFVNAVNLLNACVKLSVENMINTGSAYECGFSREPISQKECIGQPIGLYGITKRAEREYIDMVARKYKRNFVTGRLFTPFGPFDSVRRLIPHVITSLMNEITPIINEPNSGRDFIFIEDVAKIYYKLTRKPEILEGRSSFNLGTGKLTRVKDVVKILYEIAGKNYTEYASKVNKSNRYLYADYKEISDMLSKMDVRVRTLRRGLLKTSRWFTENRNLYIRKGE